MELQGQVLNGVVVFNGGATLPEGTAVTVTPRSGPVIRVAPQRTRVEFPLVRSEAPASVPLTNQRIAEILEHEECEAAPRSRDVST